jgi:hypothetical protein
MPLRHKTETQKPEKPTKGNHTMKSIIRTTLILLALTLLFAANAQANVTVEVDRVKDKGVVAQYEYIDSDGSFTSAWFGSDTNLALWYPYPANGCLTVDIIVQADFAREADTVTGKNVIPSVSVLISVYESCKFYGIIFATGSTDAFQMTIDPLLRKARLRAKIPVTNQVTNGPGDVDVDLTWDAFGPLEVNPGESRTVFPDGTVVVEHLLGKSRAASVTGTVSVVGFNYASNASSWFDNDIHDARFGVITITKP